MVVQFKFTVLLMPNGPQKITGLAFDPTLCQSEHNIADEEVKKLLTTSTKKKANKKKKANGAAAMVIAPVSVAVERKRAREREREMLALTRAAMRDPRNPHFPRPVVVVVVVSGFKPEISARIRRTVDEFRPSCFYAVRLF